MSILLVILIVTLVLIIGSGLAFFRLLSQRQTADKLKPVGQAVPEEKPKTKTAFRWGYVILPLVIMLIAAVVTIYFYGKLPEEVVYSFNSDGSPSGLLGRNEITAWALVPQFFLALIAIIIAYGAGRIKSLLGQGESAGIKLDIILLVMSNMVILPQLVLLFTMLNIFSYNAFQTHIGFLWAFLLSLAIVGVVLLSIFFVSAIRKVRSTSKH